MQLLQDVFIIENLQVLNEGSTKGPMKIRGVFGRCNEKNNNGRIYPTAVLEAQLSKVQPLISERRLCGELDHPQNDTVKLSNASHLITKLDMKGDELIGEAEVLQTPAGLTAQALVNGGVKIGISSRGMGTLSEDHDGNKIVNEDFRLVTFDLVADPSTRGAYPGLSESTESKFVRETQGKLEKESNFVTMLESKIRDAYQPWIEESRESQKTRAARLRAEAKKRKAEKAEAQANTDQLRRNPQQTLKAEAMECVRQDGHLHRMGALLADAFGHSKKKVNEGYADELERIKKEREVANPQPKDSGGVGAPGFADRWRIKRGEIAKAKGQAYGQRIKDRAAAGGDVGLRSKLPKWMGGGGAGSAAYAKETDKLATDRIAALRKDIARGTDPKPDPKPEAKPEPKVDPKPKVKPQQKKKPGISPEAAAHQAKVLGKLELKKDTEDVAAQAKAQAGDKFSAGVGRKDKDQMRKSIARQNRRRAKKGLAPLKMTDQQAQQLSHTSYKQIGNIIAEMFYLREDAEKGYAGIKGGTPEAAEKERKLKSGEYGRMGRGGGPRKKRAPVTQDETQDKREQGSTRA